MRATKLVEQVARFLVTRLDALHRWQLGRIDVYGRRGEVVRETHPAGHVADVAGRALRVEERLDLRLLERDGPLRRATVAAGVLLGASVLLGSARILR